MKDDFDGYIKGWYHFDWKSIMSKLIMKVHCRVQKCYAIVIEAHSKSQQISLCTFNYLLLYLRNPLINYSNKAYTCICHSCSLKLWNKFSDQFFNQSKFPYRRKLWWIWWMIVKFYSPIIFKFAKFWFHQMYFLICYLPKFSPIKIFLYTVINFIQLLNKHGLIWG